MSSFTVGDIFGNDSAFIEMYKAELAKRGIKYEDAPFKDGKVQVKNVTAGTKAKLAAKAFVNAPITLVKPIAKLIQELPGDVGTAAKKTAQFVPIIIVAAVLIAGAVFLPKLKK